MTRAESEPVLVTGSTGRVGRMVVDQLLDAGVSVRALTRQPATAAFPAAVEVVRGDFTVPDSLEQGLRGVSTVFLVWTLPFPAAPAAIDRMGRHARRIVFLSAPHRTAHPFFQQPNPMAKLHADIEQLITDAGVISTVSQPPQPGSPSPCSGIWSSPNVSRHDPTRVDRRTGAGSGRRRQRPSPRGRLLRRRSDRTTSQRCRYDRRPR
jgi:hypothetical protein